MKEEIVAFVKAGKPTTLDVVEHFKSSYDEDSIRSCLRDLVSSDKLIINKNWELIVA